MTKAGDGEVKQLLLLGGEVYMYSAFLNNIHLAYTYRHWNQYTGNKKLVLIILCQKHFFLLLKIVLIYWNSLLYH